MTSDLSRLIEEWRAKAELIAATETDDEAGAVMLETRSETLKMCADELSAILAASLGHKDQEEATRVDGERRAAGPTGSTAATD